MTSVEKTKKGKKSKNKNKQESESDVLERVMDSIEMVGASLEFFDEESSADSTDQSSDDSADNSDENSQTETMMADTASIDEETAAVAEPETDDAEKRVAENAENEIQDSEDNKSDNIEAMQAEATEVNDDDLSEAETMDMLEEEDSTLEFVEDKQAQSILESLLFSSDRPLGMGTFKQVFKGTNYKTKDIKKALEALQTEYADVSRGVSLEEINGGWQLRTKVDNMDFLRKLAKARPFKLSGPALEVLAIIAYKQPIVKSEVDDIRGVESGHLVRALMEKSLVCFQGKSELPGKPMQYGTTRKFLEIFGLRNLRELPSLDEIDQLLPDGIGVEEEDEKLSDVTDKMAEEFNGSYSEGQEELEKIEATLGDIDTSSEFFEEEKRRQKEKRDRDRARDIREALDVGEDVDPKDEKWLARYDERIAQEQAEAEATALAAEQAQAMAEDNDEDPASQQEPTNEDDSLVARAEPIDNELAMLSQESMISEEIIATDEALDAVDESMEEAMEAAMLDELGQDEDSDDSIEGAQSFDPFSDEEELEDSDSETSH